MNLSRFAFSPPRSLLNLLFVSSAVIIANLPAVSSAQVTRTFSGTTSLSKKSFQEIPQATEPCTPAECDWWSRLRQAGNDLQRKEDGRSKRKFVELFVEGLEKSYRVPLKDSPPKILASKFPDISDIRKYRKVNGAVELSVEYRADGSIGEIKVIKGLDSQIDNRVVQSLRQNIFLPAIRDGIFVTEWQKGGVTFFSAQ